MNKISKGLLQNISKQSKELIENLDPIKNMNSLALDKINPKDIPDILRFHKNFQISKYRFSLFLNRDIQHEIKKTNNIISNKLNNEILYRQFNYNEVNNNLFLHKQVNDLYVIVHFTSIKPSMNRKMIDEQKNYIMKEMRKGMDIENTIYKIMGGGNNVEIDQEQDEDELEWTDKKYVDKKEVKFTIDLINKRSQLLQFHCSNVMDEV